MIIYVFVRKLNNKLNYFKRNQNKRRKNNNNMKLYRPEGIL